MATPWRNPVQPREFDAPPPEGALDDGALDALLSRLPTDRRGEVEAAVPEAEHPDDRALLALCAGRCSEAEAVQIESHLAQCAACRDLLVELAEPVSPALQASAERAAAEVLPARETRPQRGRLPFVLGVLAAAGLALAIGLGRDLGTDGVSHPDFDWTREYASEDLKGGVSRTRTSTAGPSHRVQPESEVSWVLRATGTDRVPQVGIYVGRPGGTLRPLAAEVERASGGTVRVRTTGAALGGTDFGRLRWIVSLSAKPLDLAGRPTDGIESAVGPAEGAVFSKSLDYEPEGEP
jgi:hypothetical protein